MYSKRFPILGLSRSQASGCSVLLTCMRDKIVPEKLMHVHCPAVTPQNIISPVTYLQKYLRYPLVLYCLKHLYTCEKYLYAGTHLSSLELQQLRWSPLGQNRIWNETFLDCCTFKNCYPHIQLQFILPLYSNASQTHGFKLAKFSNSRFRSLLFTSKLAVPFLSTQICDSC